MIVLRRLDPVRNMARFYAMSLERSLFGEVLLVRRWGRIGTHGRVRSDWFADDADAKRALDQLAQSKGRRGYLEVAVTAERIDAYGAYSRNAASCA